MCVCASYKVPVHVLRLRHKKVLPVGEGRRSRFTLYSIIADGARRERQKHGEAIFLLLLFILYLWNLNSASVVSEKWVAVSTGPYGRGEVRQTDPRVDKLWGGEAAQSAQM